MTAAFAYVSQHNETALAEGGRGLEALEVALLLLMGHTALDSDPEPAFWLRRSEICALLGIRSTEAGKKRVQRALSALAAAGAVGLPEKYQRGHTPRYRLIYQGGYLASTPSVKAWTPDAPLTDPKGDARRPGVWTPGDRSMDARHPPEQEEQKDQEGDAQASSFELAEPPTPGPRSWDSNLAAPTSPQEAARCAKHPHGTTSSCFECGQNRRTWMTSEKRTEHTRPPTLRLRTVDGRQVCDNLPHVPTHDGTCANCEIRAEDLAHLIGAIA